MAPAPAYAEGSFRPEIYSVLGRQRQTGLHLGKFGLHGAFGFTNSYDSNAFYADSAPQSDYVLQLIPGADITFDSIRLTGTAGYRYTFRQYASSHLQDNRAHSANMDLSYRMSRRFTVAAADRFEKTSDPADVEIPERLGRWTNEASGQVTYKTPGEDFDLGMKYMNTYQKYEGILSALSFYNNKVSVTSRVNISSHFRFLPKSVASANLEYGQTNFNNAGATGAANSDSRGVSFSAGLTSQFSRKTSVSLSAGASSIFFQSGPNAITATGGASFNYHPGETLSLTAGYQRSAQVSTFTNYYEDHRINLDANWKFARRFEYYMKNTLDFLSFSGPNVTATGVKRDDMLWRTMTGVSCVLAPWAKMRVEYQFDYRDSNAADPFFGTQSADFARHEATLGIDFYY